MGDSREHGLWALLVDIFLLCTGVQKRLIDMVFVNASRGPTVLILRAFHIDVR